MRVHIGPYPDRDQEERIVEVEIHEYDTWNMDSTLTSIILPMLKQLQLQKGGTPMVDDADVPEELRSTAVPPVDSSYGEVDDNWFKRWDYVLGEMIFAFEAKDASDYTSQFWSRDPEIDFTERSEDEGKEFRELRWADIGECDWDGLRAYEARMQKGFELFGKYFQSLWS